MEMIRRLAGMSRLVAVVVGLAVGVMYAPAVFAAAPLNINVHVDGVAGEDGNGNYTASSYAWGEPGQHLVGASPELSFSQSVGAPAISGPAIIELMNAVETHQKAATADVQLVCSAPPTPVVAIDYHMTGVHFVSISDRGFDPTIYPLQPLNGTSPFESATLRFTGLVYTNQPILPNCQKNGPPVTFTWTF